MPLSSGSRPGSMRYAAFGTELAGGVILPIILGLYVDRTWGYTPWGLLAGVAIGILFAVLSLTKLVIRVQRENKEQDQDRP